MAYIPRRNYASAHLNQIRLITGIEDWFSFLDCEDRLVQLMEVSRPASKIEHDDNPDSCLSYCDWSLLGLLEWYGLWVQKTPREDWLFKQIAILNRDWWDTGGYFEPLTPEATAVIARFRRLVSLAKGETLD